jgi:hypothetical protein
MQGLDIVRESAPACASEMEQTAGFFPKNQRSYTGAILGGPEPLPDPRVAPLPERPGATGSPRHRLHARPACRLADVASCRHRVRGTTGQIGDQNRVCRQVSTGEWPNGAENLSWCRHAPPQQVAWGVSTRPRFPPLSRQNPRRPVSTPLSSNTPTRSHLAPKPREGTDFDPQQPRSGAGVPCP